jgi:DNA replication protein DnaC
MLTHPTVEQLHQLGLDGMARAFSELEANPTSAALSHAEWLALLLDREATERYERRLRGRLRFARLHHQATVEDVDYPAARGLDRTLFQALIAGRWIDEAQNLVIEGPAGVRKSWLACALGPRRAATTAQCCTSAFRGCSAISLWPAAMAATRA